MSDPQVTVPAAQFAQMLRQKFPQHASVADERLIEAFIQKNPQYKVAYEGTTPVSVSWERPAPVPAPEPEQPTAKVPSLAPVVKTEPAAFPVMAAIPATFTSPTTTSKVEAVCAPAAEEPSEARPEAEPDTPTTKQCVACGLVIPASARFCLECGASQGGKDEAIAAEPSSVSGESNGGANETPSLEPEDTATSISEGVEPKSVENLHTQDLAPATTEDKPSGQTVVMEDSAGVAEIPDAGDAQRPKKNTRRFMILAVVAACLAISASALYFGWGHITSSPMIQQVLCVGYRIAADHGSARAQYRLGRAYELGEGVPRDYSEAVRWYRKAAEQGSAKGQNNLGVMYLEGRGGLPKDETQAVSWYRKAAEQGNAFGQENLADMYLGGRGGLPKDDAQAVSWYRKAAEQGNAAAQVSLSSMYYKGRGVPKDETESVRWTRKAAEQGDAWGQAVLGSMYAEGHGGLPKDDAQAVSWYRKAAEQENAFSQYILGVMYRDGRGGLPKDDAQAVSWLRKAAEKGNAEAQTSLGYMYEKGRGGLPKDETQAVSWYRKAAEQGDSIGQRNLGVMYEDGRGGLPQDDVQAASWYRKASAQGYVAESPNLVNSPEASDPFEGLVLGGSLPQTVNALKGRGFPTNQGCDDEGGGYETCYSRKGEPEGNDVEALALHIHDGHLYAVEYEFPKAKYASIFGVLTQAHGEPSHQKGVTFWNLETDSQRITLDANGPTYKGHKLAKAILADIKSVAGKYVDDAVNGRGRFAH